MHHPITVLRQACKAEAAAAQPLPQPQPQPLSQPQPKSQLQQQADAQARAAAQHAKAKQAQAEYRRLQHHFAQLEQLGRIKGPPWQCPGSAFAPSQRTIISPGQLDTPGGHGRPVILPPSQQPSKSPIQLRLVLQGAGAAVATGSVGCGRGAPRGAATAAEGPQGYGEHRTN